jgi:hypothetical protein
MFVLLKHAIKTGGTMMIGRKAESDLIERTILAASGKMLFPAVGFHISGEKDVGKTELVKHVRASLADIDNAVGIGPEAETVRYLAYPLDELIGIRNAMRKAYRRFDSEAFDLALAVFVQKFPRPGRELLTLPGVEKPLTDVFRASFGDTIKKGAEETLTDIKAWATTTLGAGGSVGGAAKAGGMIKGATVALTWAGVASVAAQAATAGVATLTVAAGGRLVYHLVKGVRLRARHGTFQARFPELDAILSTPERNYGEFFKYLAYMLADAIRHAHDGERGYIPVLFLDPGDDLAEEPESPMAQVGKAYAQVLDHVIHKVVIASSRSELSIWWAGACSARTAPELEYQAIVLGNIPLSEAERWCQARAYDGTWPPENLSTFDDGTVAPKKLVDWWAGRDGREPEGEVA